MVSSHAYDAVIVGAGPNGLAAAIRIAQQGFSTLVLEERPRLGALAAPKSSLYRGSATTSALQFIRSR